MPNPKSKPKSLADFRNAHDPNVMIPKRIAEGLAAMLKEGKENWEYEIDFLRRCGLSTTQLAQYREQFAKHVVETYATSSRSARRVWFADPKIADQVRSI